LKGATADGLDDLEHTIDGGVNLIRSLLQDRWLVPGAGATELELARRVEVYRGRMKGRRRYAVKGFTTALEVTVSRERWRRTRWREGGEQGC
jgi:T-complex protein 1 subunit theta